MNDFLKLNCQSRRPLLKKKPISNTPSLILANRPWILGIKYRKKYQQRFHEPIVIDKASTVPEPGPSPTSKVGIWFQYCLQ
jgi:hypothetical protein